MTFRYIFAGTLALVTSIGEDFPAAGILDNTDRGYIEVTVDDSLKPSFDSSLPAVPVLGPVAVTPGQGSILTVCVPLGTEDGLRAAALAAASSSLKTEANQFLSLFDATEVQVPEI
jgi:hypothetical protein